MATSRCLKCIYVLDGCNKQFYHISFYYIFTCNVLKILVEHKLFMNVCFFFIFRWTCIWTFLQTYRTIESVNPEGVPERAQYSDNPMLMLYLYKKNLKTGYIWRRKMDHVDSIFFNLTFKRILIPRSVILFNLFL